MANEKRAGAKAGKGGAPIRVAAVERVHQTLTSDVVDIYTQHVPAFKGLSREKVYEMVMGSPALAAECYSLFLKRPELFAHLMTDRAGNPVVSDEERLSCGRSIKEVTAMVVRAVAKRYFLRRFGAKPPEPRPEPKPDLTTRLIYLFNKPPPKPKPRRKATRGDSLYRAMRHYLLYHWQLRLIPHYTPLPVSLVRQLGARILDYKTAGELKQLLKDGPQPATSDGQPTPADAMSALIRVKLPTPKRATTVGEAKTEAMWAVAEAMRLAETFGVDKLEMRRIVNHASVASGPVISALAASGLKMRNLVVMLCVFERHFGQTRMPTLFGHQAPQAFIDALARQIRAYGLTELENPEDIRNRVDVMIRKMQREQQLPR